MNTIHTYLKEENHNTPGIKYTRYTIHYKLCTKQNKKNTKQYKLIKIRLYLFICNLPFSCHSINTNKCLFNPANLPALSNKQDVNDMINFAISRKINTLRLWNRLFVSSARDFWVNCSFTFLEKVCVRAFYYAPADWNCYSATVCLQQHYYRWVES